VEIGKQLLMTRGALTTLQPGERACRSIFAIIPAALSAPIRRLAGLTSCTWQRRPAAILSAVVFNALIIVALIPLALRGVR